MSAGLIRIFVFKDEKNFFRLYFSLSLINPFLSSAIYYFSFFEIIEINLIIAKIIGDILTSLFLFIILLKKSIIIWHLLSLTLLWVYVGYLWEERCLL